MHSVLEGLIYFCCARDTNLFEPRATSWMLQSYLIDTRSPKRKTKRPFVYLFGDLVLTTRFRAIVFALLIQIIERDLFLKPHYQSSKIFSNIFKTSWREIYVLLLLLPNFLGEMGAWRKTIKQQKPGNQGPGPKVVRKR